MVSPIFYSRRQSLGNTEAHSKENVFGYIYDDDVNYN